MTCNLSSETCGCPFAFTDTSEMIQNYGCLPTPYDIINMRVKYNKTWSCHMEPTKPCIGAIEYLKEKGLPYKVIDPVLITELDNWSQYTENNQYEA